MVYPVEIDYLNLFRSREGPSPMPGHFQAKIPGKIYIFLEISGPLALQLIFSSNEHSFMIVLKSL